MKTIRCMVTVFVLSLIFFQSQTQDTLGPIVFIGGYAPMQPDGGIVLYEPQTQHAQLLLKIEGEGFEDFYQIPWTPDAPRIMWSSSDARILYFLGDFVVIDAATQQIDRYVSNIDGIACPSWSNDGAGIVFTGDTGSTRELFLLDLTTQETTKLTENTYEELCVDGDPVSGRYVISAVVDSQTDIFITDERFETFTSLTQDKAEETLPLWSPNGQYIAFRTRIETVEEALYTLNVVNVAQNTRIEIDRRNFIESYSWRSDGRFSYIEPDFPADTEEYEMKIRSIDVASGLSALTVLPSYTGFFVFDWSAGPIVQVSQPTPTAPSPDLNLPAAPECPAAPPSRLGMLMIAAVVVPPEGEVRSTLRIRAQPGGQQVGSLLPGQHIRITDQGVCGDDGLLWWPIETIEGDLRGWSAEGLKPSTYFMEPISTR